MCRYYIYDVILNIDHGRQSRAWSAVEGEAVIMMRALWSAASGMRAQQANVDAISNNLANVNTVGYKTEKPEFKSDRKSVV